MSLILLSKNNLLIKNILKHNKYFQNNFSNFSKNFPSFLIYSKQQLKSTNHNLFFSREKNRYHGFSDGNRRNYSLIHKLFVSFISLSLTVTVLTEFWSWVCKAESVTKIKEEEEEEEEDEKKEKEKEEEEEEEGEKAEKPKRKRIGFRERKFIEYENRIRDYSTPDKIFRYFATRKIILDKSDFEVFMTPEDFVRSITPSYKQDENLGLDKFLKYDPKFDKLNSKFGRESIFWKFGNDGLICFSDYMFLLVVLSTPPRSVEIAFKMFDLNGDGNLDIEEFERVTEVLRSNSPVGKRHRDHLVTGNTLKAINIGLNKYFFGEKLDKKLSVEMFLEFQKKLLVELLMLEFDRYPKINNSKITERDFADSILVFMRQNFNKKNKMLKKVKKIFQNSEGISFEEYESFYKVLKYINDIDVALIFYNIAGASIDKQTLKHVAKTVAHVDLSDHLIDVVFIIFDENDDGELSHKEFVSVMKRRLMRGLQEPRDTGLVKILLAIWNCAKNQLPNYIEQL